MLDIKGYNITMTRGDTALITLSIYTSCGDEYVPTEGDVIRFALKKNYKASDVLILKDIPTDTLLLRIEHEDTESLDYGTYEYDIEITHADGVVDTFITKSNLTLTPEVY